MAARIALIRAINVGGVHLGMEQLRNAATELGATDVSTYIASGNLLYTPSGDPEAFDRALEGSLQDLLGVFREVISRTPDQLAAALAAHPFPVQEAKRSYIYPLTGTPRTGGVDLLAQRAKTGEQVAVVGDDLHIRYPEGQPAPGSPHQPSSGISA